MKEIRETVGVAALLVGVCSVFLFVSIFMGMLAFSGGDDLYLLKMMIVDAMVMVVSFATAWIAGDKVWERKNLPDEERKRLFNLR